MNRNRSIISYPLILLLLVPFLLAGCIANKSFVSWGYSILDTSTITYNTSMSVIADLDSRGKLTLEQKELAISVARKYRKTTLAAIELLAQYKEWSSMERSSNYEKVEAAILAVNAVGQELLQLLTEFGVIPSAELNGVRHDMKATNEMFQGFLAAYPGRSSQGV